MKGRLFAHLGLRVGGRAPCDGAGEFFGAAIDAHVDVGRVPAIARRRVVRTGRRDADQVGQRPHHHIVAGPRPRLVAAQNAVGINEGVVKEVDGHPAGSAFNASALQRVVEVLRTVDVPRIAKVVIVFRTAGHRKGVVAAHRVLNDLDQRFKILIEVFRVQARHRIGMPHEGARGRHIQRALQSLVDLAGAEALEIRHLPALDIKDLDELTRLDVIGPRGRGFDADLLHRVRQWVRQIEGGAQAGIGPGQQHRQRRCRVLTVRAHRRTRSRNHQMAVAGQGKAFGCLGPRRQIKKPHRPGPRQIDPAPHKALPQPRRSLTAEAQQGPQPLGPGIAGHTQQPRIDPPVGMGRDDLAHLRALVIGHAHHVALSHRQHQRPASRHDMPLAPGKADQTVGCPDLTGARRAGDHLGIGTVEHHASGTQF